MKVHIKTSEGTEGRLRKTKIYTLTCRISLTPDEARIFPDSGTTVTELTHDYSDEGELPRRIIYLRNAVEEEAKIAVRSLGQLKECEDVIISRCMEVQASLNALQGFKIEKSYTVDLIELSAETEEPRDPPTSRSDQKDAEATTEAVSKPPETPKGRSGLLSRKPKRNKEQGIADWARLRDE